MTLSELQTKRDTLLANIAAAIRQLQSGDKSVTYQSIEQMREALAVIDSEIDKASGATAVKQVRFYTRSY